MEPMIDLLHVLSRLKTSVGSGGARGPTRGSKYSIQ